jgi:hypothetical protein
LEDSLFGWLLVYALVFVFGWGFFPLGGISNGNIYIDLISSKNGS